MWRYEEHPHSLKCSRARTGPSPYERHTGPMSIKAYTILARRAHDFVVTLGTCTNHVFPIRSKIMTGFRAVNRPFMELVEDRRAHMAAELSGCLLAAEERGAAASTGDDDGKVAAVAVT
jgi:hypothetical protein